MCQTLGTWVGEGGVIDKTKITALKLENILQLHRVLLRILAVWITKQVILDLMQGL